ncbi:MAG: thioredoxin-like domain-containing protein [Bacteroidota bacterium]
MRKIWIVMAIIGLVGCNGGKRYRISGTIHGAADKMLYFEEVELDKVVAIDSVKLGPSGKFTFSQKAETDNFYQLKVGGKVISLILSPGEKASLNAEYTALPSQYSIEGSDGSVLISKLNNRMNETRVLMDSLETVYNEELMKGAEKALLDSISKQYREAVDNQRKFNIAFILNFYDNLAGLFALYQKVDDNTLLFNRNRDVQYYKILSDSLPKFHPESKHVKALQYNTEDLIKRVQQQKVSNLIEGVEPSLPDIALPNPERDTIRLSSLKGKVVILSFWSSASEASTRENLRLKSIYEKYHPRGLEIYQVSLDTDFDSWTRAIRFDELPWINVSGLDYPNSEAAALYNIQELPTFYLIDRQQQDILGKDLTNRKLEIKLNNLLN